jgi:hypothetical protein
MHKKKTYNSIVNYFFALAANNWYPFSSSCVIIFLL